MCYVHNCILNISAIAIIIEMIAAGKGIILRVCVWLSVFHAMRVCEATYLYTYVCKRKEHIICRGIYVK